MTYEIGIEVDHGAAELPWLLDEWWKYTGSCVALGLAAGVDLVALHGKLAEECVIPLANALRALRVDPDYLPESGNLHASLVGRLNVLLGWLSRNTKATVRVTVCPAKPRRAPRKKSTSSSTASRRRSKG